MRRALIIGNWKMHGSLKEAAELLGKVKQHAESMSEVDCAVCVPFPYLAQVQSLLTGTQITWGAQNINEHLKGAYTGEVSASMLLDFACRYVLIGHSERRSLFGESDEIVAAKFIMAQNAGLIPVLCVGETLAERDAGSMFSVVTRQIDSVLKKTSIEAFANAVIAYEPVWAIGTGRTASPEQAQEIHAMIRSKFINLDQVIGENLKILYGGSVKPDNAAELFAQADIDGGLIGGASLIAEDFLSICRSVASVRK